MSDDIRLQSDWYQNPKIKKLGILVGPQGIVSLLTLWAWTGKNRPNGVLHDMDELDIILAANWPNDVSLFMDSLLKLRLLDREEPWYVIHDWARNQPWALHTEDRKSAARKAAETRWAKEGKNEKVSSQCDSHENQCDSHDFVCATHESALRNMPKSDAPFLSFPSPSPFPIPNPPEEKNPPTPRKRGKREKSHDFDLSVLVLPDWLPAEPWQQYILHRQRIKKPMSVYAAEITIRELNIARENKWSPEELLNNAITNGYQGCVYDKHKQPKLETPIFNQNPTFNTGANYGYQKLSPANAERKKIADYERKLREDCAALETCRVEKDITGFGNRVA